MTYWVWENYGSILQCYALQKYLQEMGHDVYLIRYDPRKDSYKLNILEKMARVINPIKLYGYIKLKIVNNYERKYKSRKFDVFLKMHIVQSEKIYYSYAELKENPPVADMYIVGSDQVWNFNDINLKANIHAYFLDFGRPETKRISYAASFGKDIIQDSFVEVIGPLLKKFDYVSVREKTGLNICKECGIHNAELMPDPTLITNVNIYRSLYSEGLFTKPNKPYCFLYLLSKKIDISTKKIYDWAKNENLGVIYITANDRVDRYKKIYATIAKWIFLLENAEYIITDSYHASIFSILFKKKFGVIRHSGRTMMQNSRFDTLFDLLQLEKRYISQDDFSVVKKEIDWYFNSNILENMKKSCILNKFYNKNNKLD